MYLRRLPGSSECTVANVLRSLLLEKAQITQMFTPDADLRMATGFYGYRMKLSTVPLQTLALSILQLWPSMWQSLPVGWGFSSTMKQALCPFSMSQTMAHSSTSSLIVAFLSLLIHISILGTVQPPWPCVHRALEVFLIDFLRHFLPWDSCAPGHTCAIHTSLPCGLPSLLENSLVHEMHDISGLN